MSRFNPTGKGGSLLDNGVAALAALSSGFLVYAMPDGLFSRIVIASRLPQFLAAAQPPLGMKARLAVIAVVAAVAYAFVWSLLRALDTIGGKAQPVIVPAAAPEAPRLRRADAHPDAPSRRPIFAGRELGEPGEDEEPLELAAETAFEPEAEPEFEPYDQAAFEPQPGYEPEPEPEVGSERVPAFLVPQQPEHEAWDAHQAPAYDDEPAAFDEPAAEPIEAEGIWHRQAPADEYHDDYSEEGEEEDEPEEAEGDEGDDQSLARLMQRFESGLGRKQQALSPAPPAAVPSVEPDPVPQERVGHRLRSAISDLNKMSAPGR